MQQGKISNFESLSKEDMTKHAGKWIAVVDGKVVISSDSFKKVNSFTKEKYPNKKALFGKLPDSQYCVFSVN